MGRVLLLILAGGSLALAACGTPRGDDPGTGPTDHAALTCVTCHRGEVASTGEPAVPREACTGSGCHAGGGPGRLTVGSVTFDHRDHGGAEAQVEMACAGCHTHTSGDEPIYAATDACSLCHAEALDGDDPGDCRTCHGDPGHQGSTSQGVAIAHEGLPWIQGECVRCHYDVTDPPQTVSAVTCARCHQPVETVTTAGLGEDLHPAHTGVGCVSCHASHSHHIVKMTSAVDLVCSDCHLAVHDVRPTPEWPAAPTCNACHGEVHEAQQRLVLGAVPHGVDALPSEKFLDGLTCRSCHVPSPGTRESGSVALAGSEVSCSGCHRSEYRTVLRWWNEGTRQRIRLVDDFVTRAEAAAGEAAPDTVRALVTSARELLDLVEQAGGEHNLPLAHRLFAESLDRATAAWRAAGGTPPSPPALGTRPRMGLCSYCHYRIDDAWRLGDMDERFHREVLGVTRLERNAGSR